METSTPSTSSFPNPLPSFVPINQGSPVVIQGNKPRFLKIKVLQRSGTGTLTDVSSGISQLIPLTQTTLASSTTTLQSSATATITSEEAANNSVVAAHTEPDASAAEEAIESTAELEDFIVDSVSELAQQQADLDSFADVTHSIKSEATVDDVTHFVGDEQVLVDDAGNVFELDGSMPAEVVMYENAQEVQEVTVSSGEALAMGDDVEVIVRSAEEAEESQVEEATTEVQRILTQDTPGSRARIDDIMKDTGGRFDWSTDFERRHRFSCE